MNSEERMNIEIKEELHEEITYDGNGGEQMDALFSNKTVKLENETKNELPGEVFDNEIDDNTKYFCELCKSYFPSLSSLQDHMQSHDNCDEKYDINDDVNFEETINTEVKEESIEEKRRKKLDNKEKEKTVEKKTIRKRQCTEEKDYRINFKKDFNENNKCENINMIMKDHIIFGNKHHDGKIDKASVKNIKEETEVLNENYNDEPVNLIMKDRVILRTNHHDGIIINIKTEASEEPLRNPICENANNAKTSDGHNQVGNELSETRHNTILNAIDHDHVYDFSYKNRKKKLGSKELAIENIPATSISPNSLNQFDINVSNKSFATSNKLKIHVSNSHKTVFCDVCQKKFSCKVYLDQHVKRVHLRIKEEWKCEFCGNCYSSKCSLWHHTMFVCAKNKNKRPHKYNKLINITKVTCKLCGKKYMSQKSFEMHMADHPKYVCDDCGKIYYYRYYLERHIKSSHLNKNSTKVTCKLCSNRYMSQKTYEMHMADHPRFICDYCDKIYYFRYHIEKHIRISHLKVRSRCKKCGHECADLYGHMKRCNINVPQQSPHMPNQFDCNVCSRSFETNRKLQNHKYNSHRRSSAFCDVCQKKFSNKGNLNEHVKRVHLGDKVECKFCGKRYTYRSSLGFHIKKCSENKNKRLDKDIKFKVLTY